MATTPRDPKTIVTPDAFFVHPSLLGTPLASPSRRGVALLIDVFLVILITALTSGFWFILGVVAAAFFFTRAKKEGENDRRANLLRYSLGCMGVMALSVTAVVFFGIRYVNQRPDDFGSFFSIEGETPGAFVVGAPSGSAPDRLRTLFGGFPEGALLASTDDPDEAVALAVSRVQTLEPNEDVVDLLQDLIPDQVGRVDGREILDRALIQLSSPPSDDGVDTVGTEDLPVDSADAAAADDAAQRLVQIPSNWRETRSGSSNWVWCVPSATYSTLAPTSTTPFSDAASSDGSPAESTRWASALVGGHSTSPFSCPG
jgi:hypothetical protein